MKMLKIISLCVLVAFLVPIASADLYYETKVTGQPGENGPTTNKTYLSEIGMRMEMGNDSVMIINYKDQVFIDLDVKAKTYTMTRFEDFMKPQDGEDAEMAAQMEKMMEQMIGSMQVTKTDETQEINGYKCTKYIVSIMGMASDYWVTKDVKDYDIMMSQSDKFKEVFSKNPMLKGLSSSIDMMKKVDGFPVKTINKMMGMEIVSETTKIENKKIDSAVFQPPTDYAKVEAKN